MSGSFKVPFQDLPLQTAALRPELDAVIDRVLRHCGFIHGKECAEFEAAFAAFVGTKAAVGLGSGTDALQFICRGLGISGDDEVITVANSFMATSETISQAGAKPVFVDNDEYYHIDPKLIEAKITPRTKAVIPVHIYGQAVDIEAVKAICDRHKLHLVEDCAQSHFATYRGRKTGTFGIAGTFSFYPGKNLGAYGDGGAIVTDDDDFARRARLFANHGSLQKHVHEIEGVNSRLDAIQAVVLKAKLGHIDDWNKARNSHALKYNELLAGIPQIAIPKLRADAFHIFHLYVIRAERRDELAAFLKDKGVATGIHYAKALPLTPAYGYLGHKPEDFPLAGAWQDRILSLPMFPELTDGQIAYVADAIGEFYKK